MMRSKQDLLIELYKLKFKYPHIPEYFKIVVNLTDDELEEYQDLLERREYTKNELIYNYTNKLKTFFGMTDEEIEAELLMKKLSEV